MRTAPNARLAYVTPSNQFPTGIAMGASRRLELLQWAKAQGSWIVEDDYDSEFRFSGPPLASLYAMQSAAGFTDHVIYCGSFSKTLFPALKLGYLVLPQALVAPLLAVRAMIGREPPTLEQAILADFIGEGHYGRHLRRMRALYAERAQALEQSIERHFGERLRIGRIQGGLQGFARCARKEPIEAWRKAASEAGAMPEFFSFGERSAIAMGFANTPPERIETTIAAFARGVGQAPAPPRGA
jgi:GntR family transcriptional regulator/MocR family aminotransferase